MLAFSEAALSLANLTSVAEKNPTGNQPYVKKNVVDIANYSGVSKGIMLYLFCMCIQHEVCF